MSDEPTAPTTQYKSKIEFKVSVYAYSGRYGPESTTGDIVVASINCGTGPSPLSHKEIFLVVDLSGSMRESIPALKASLHAFRDTLINRQQLPKSASADEIEKLFRASVNVTLIGYSTNAWLIYSTDDTDPTQTWDKCIDDEVYSRNSTNIGAGVQMAFNRIHSKRCSWVVVMSDGMPNYGDYQSTESFRVLAKSSPSNTRIITLGYGNDFNANVLCNLGEFTYVATQEQIPMVFGSIINEVVQAWGFDGKWDIEGYPGDMEKVLFVVGAPTFGSLYNERKYVIILLVKDKFLEFTEKGIINISFTNIENLKTITVPFHIHFVSEIPPASLRQKYYAAAKGRRMERFYRLIQNTDKSKTVAFCTNLKKELEEWTEDCAIKHREELLRLIEDFDTAYRTDGNNLGYKTLRSTVAARSADMSRQTSFTVLEEYTTSQQIAATSTKNYMSSYVTIKRN